MPIASLPFVRPSPKLEFTIIVGLDRGDLKGELEKHEQNQAKAILLVGLGFLGVMTPSAIADESDQKTIFTFSGPVAIPGQVLQAGTYVLRLADSESDREIVQVFNKDQTHLYGTFFAIPDERLRPAGKPIITFNEAPAGSLEAVRTWFYPADECGHEFVYPKADAVALA
jgi:hypothetical protein